MRPEVSVIIPFYKTSTIKLSVCIESFLRQEFRSFEILMIDDGSLKDYSGIKNYYESKDNRIRFLHQDNAGVSAARNKGLEEAKGKYIVFCDSDDFVENNFLQSLVWAIQDCDLAICGIEEQYYPSIQSKVDMRIFWSTPSQYNWLQYVNFSVNKIYKSDIINKNRLKFPKGVKLGEDALFLASYLQCCRQIRCIPGRLYHYVPDASSVVHSFHSKYWDWEENIICTQWDLFHQYPLSDVEEQYMTFWLLNKLRGSLYYYIDHEKKNPVQRRRYIEKVVKSRPYKILMKHATNKKANPFFSKRDRRTLLQWKYAQKEGPMLSYYADIWRQKLNRLKRKIKLHKW